MRETLNSALAEVSMPIEATEQKTKGRDSPSSAENRTGDRERDCEASSANNWTKKENGRQPIHLGKYGKAVHQQTAPCTTITGMTSQEQTTAQASGDDTTKYVLLDTQKHNKYLNKYSSYYTE